MTFDRYCQICVLVAVEVKWHLQICNSCFYQVSESWLMVLLYISYESLREKGSLDFSSDQSFRTCPAS